MDVLISLERWYPTKPSWVNSNEASGNKRSPEELALLLTQQTKYLTKHHYDLEVWLARAVTLECLGYPELAVGDTWKAGVLCRTLLNGLENYKSRLGYRMGFWMKDELSETNGEHQKSDQDGLQSRLQFLQREIEIVQERNLHSDPVLDEGNFVWKAYPWLESRHEKRDDALLAMLNQELADRANSDSKEPCIVKRHAFGRGQDESSTSELLGVFATCRLQKGHLLLRDESRIWGCNGPGKGGSVANLNGAECCGDPLHPNMDTDDFSEDLRWVRERLGTQSSDVLLLLRALLCCIQDHVAHPLDHPLIARLTPAYHRQEPTHFYLEQDIAIPNEALQGFGVDVFADRNFETWIIFTVNARLGNNSWSDPIASCLSPLFALFNHSCEPNVVWNSGDGHEALEMVTVRDIEAGEQLFVEYDSYAHNDPVKKRKERMGRWIEGGCKCTRCVREEIEAAAAGDGKEDEGAEGSDGAKRAAWDVDERPIFPEDL